MLVALRRRRLGRFARHGARARRDDYPSLGMAFDDSAIDILAIVGSVPRERSDRTRDLVEQGANLRAVIDIVGRQLRRNDPAGVSIHADVHLPPGSAPSRAMLLDQPLPGSAELQTRAVHQQMNGLRIAARPRPRHLQGLGPAAQGGMVGNREIEIQQANDRADQAFGLAQSQAEHGFERQRRRDRQIRVDAMGSGERTGTIVAGQNRRGAPMPKPNDLSRSLTAFEQDSTLIVVIEMSQASWLVAGIVAGIVPGIVPGVDREPLKKLEPNGDALLRLLQRWRDE